MTASNSGKNSVVFSELVEKWKELVQQDRAKADAFYREKILPLSAASFSEKYARVRSQIKYLISLVGFSPEPLVLMLHAVQPEKTLFLYTKEAKKSLEVIWQYYSFQSPVEHDLQEIESSEVESVYEKIKAFLKDKNPKEVAVDVTGGKKAMVSGASAAAALAGCRIFYVDYSEYDPALRKPIPGTEYMNELKNPIEVFGEIDAEKGKELFNKGDFSAATEVFGRLENNVMHPERYQLLKALAVFFNLWEEYNFNRAFKNLGQLEQLIERFRRFKDWLPSIKQYKEIFSHLIERDERYLVLNHYFLALRYQSRSRSDFAALLLYRTLEMATAFHLKATYHLTPRDPHYAPYPQLPARYEELIRWLYGRRTFKVTLPFRIGLMDGLVLLKALDDPMIPDKTILIDIKKIADIRNDSILAHGTKEVGSKNVEKMATAFRPFLDYFVKQHLGKETIADFSPQFEVIKL